MTETPVAIDSCLSQRIAIGASVLVLLVVSPVESQIISQSQTPIQPINPRVNRTNPPATRIPTSPGIPRRPPFQLTTPTATPSPAPIAQITEIIGRLVKTATLEVSPSAQVEVEQEVTLTVVSQLPRAVEYRFNFGEGAPTEWIRKPWTTHAYSSPGEYQASAEIGLGGRKLEVPTIVGPWLQVLPRPSPSPTSTSTSVPVTAPPTPYTPSSPIATALPTAAPVSPPLEVYLSVDKNPTSIGERVIFSITTNLTERHRRYRYEVDFGDKSKPSQTDGNSVPHIFKTAGNYTASVKVVDGRSRAHNELGIFVRGRTTPRRLWVYVLIGLAVVALAYLLYPRPKPNLAMAVRPTFHPRTDWDAPQKPQEHLAIDYELHFQSNLSSGQNWLQINGPNLILRKAIQ